MWTVISLGAGGVRFSFYFSQLSGCLQLMEHLEIVGRQNLVVLSSSTVGENNKENIHFKAYSFVCFLRQFTDTLFVQI